MTTESITPAAQGDVFDPSDTNENKFLTFRLGKEEYGVEILRVREIIGMLDVTPLPQTPEYVKGVINLRGKIIPVIELRAKFALPSIEVTEETCIIVVEVTDPEGGDHFQTGVIVDTVSEVIDIDREQIEPAPKFGCSLNTDYILGMGKIKLADVEKVIILLEIDRVLNSEDLESLSSIRSDSKVEAQAKSNGTREEESAVKSDASSSTDETTTAVQGESLAA